MLYTMKIVYCLNSIRGLGGIQRVTIVKANALAEISSNEVYLVITDDHMDHPLIHPLSDKVKLIHLPVNYYDDDYKTDLRSRLRQKIIFVKHLFYLQETINKIKPDILISVGQSEKWFLPIIKTDASKIREIHFNSNYRDFTIPCVIKRKLISWLDFSINCRGYDRVVLLTKEDKEQNFPTRKNFIYIHNPLTMEKLNGNGEKRKIVLAVGRLVEQKNFSLLIKVWSKIADEAKEWKLRIIGDGPEKAKLSTLISDLGCSHCIELPGYSDKVHKEMVEASFYVATSKYEGFMLTLLEAIGSGLPCVSFIFPYGPKDIITDGVDGLLISQGDEKELADGMIRLIKNPVLRNNMGKNALKKAECFTLASIIERWMNLFVELRK